MGNTEGMEPYSLSVGPLGMYDPPLDEEIAEAVHRINEIGIYTSESCQGGLGHFVGCDNSPSPFVSFKGDWRDGFTALSLFLHHSRYEVAELRRTWRIIDGEPEGPWWYLVFAPISPRG